MAHTIIVHRAGIPYRFSLSTTQFIGPSSFKVPAQLLSDSHTLGDHSDCPHSFQSPMQGSGVPRGLWGINTLRETTVTSRTAHITLASTCHSHFSASCSSPDTPHVCKAVSLMAVIKMNRVQKSGLKGTEGGGVRHCPKLRRCPVCKDVPVQLVRKCVRTKKNIFIYMY